MAAKTITALAAELGVSRAVVNLALERGELADGFDVDDRGRRFVSDPEAARAALAAHLRNPPRRGRPPEYEQRGPRAPVCGGPQEVAWRKRCIDARNKAACALERAGMPPEAFQAVHEHLAALDELLADGVCGPLL